MDPGAAAALFGEVVDWMSVDRIFYRARQFWHTLTGKLSHRNWEEVRSALAPDLLALFTEMSDPEQTHGFRVYRRLKVEGYQDPDLLAAALLHDVGKNRSPLTVWERVWIVIASPIFSQSSKPNTSPAQGEDRNPMTVAKRHPAWGAEMALQRGASSITAWLIRNHERKDVEGVEDTSRLRMLRALIKADDMC
jgi:hypothetical protein